MSIADNLKRIKDEISEIELKSNRTQGSVKLVAVSKFHPSDAVIEAINAGQNLFGENRVQEAAEKFEQVRNVFPSVDLHMIGVLQRNKVKEAVKISSCIESVDRIELLDEIEKQCAKIDKKIKILFEYHTGEESKSGFENFDSLHKAVELCAEGKYSHIVPAGFMTMAPFVQDESIIRKSFSTLRETSVKIIKDFPDMPLTELSMGMSGDYKIAISEGSTIVRIGTAIFGERDYSKS